MALDMSTLPWLGIAIAVVVNFALGGLWYHRKAPTGRAWMRAQGMDPDALAPPPPGALARGLAIQVVGAVLIMTTLAYVFVGMKGLYTAPLTWLDGALGGLFVWLGFFLPLLMGPLAWERRPFSFVAVNAGYWLVSLVAAGAILAATMP